jgi:CubicO group peptidase (beta-lactamase class C family)
MILFDSGEFLLTDPVKKYVPEFRGGDREIVTIHHILTHTSGLQDGFPELNSLVRGDAPLKEFLRATYALPLRFKPGSQFGYSNLGVLLAAEIAERITGISFREFLASHLFKPLKMTATSLGLGGRSAASASLPLPQRLDSGQRQQNQ